MSEAWDDRTDCMDHGRSIPPTPVEAVQRFGPAASHLRWYAETLATEGVLRGLIGPQEVARIWDRHILNSAALLPLLPGSGHVADVGSGAGLPGLVIAILRPDLTVTLVEPLLRRVRFLNKCVDELRLENCRILRARAQEATDLSVDVVVARAVAPLDRLARLCLPRLKPGGELLALKGDTAEAELLAAENDLRSLGASSWSVVRVRPPLAHAEATVVRVIMSTQPLSRRAHRKPSGSKEARRVGPRTEGRTHGRQAPTSSRDSTTEGRRRRASGPKRRGRS